MKSKSLYDGKKNHNLYIQRIAGIITAFLMLLLLIHVNGFLAVAVFAFFALTSVGLIPALPGGVLGALSPLPVRVIKTKKVSRKNRFNKSNKSGKGKVIVMAFIFSPNNLTFTEKQVMEMSELVMEGFFAKPELNMFHTIVPGIKAGKKIGIVGNLGLVGQEIEACTFPVESGVIPTLQKAWDPKMIGFQRTDCWADVKDTFFEWGLKNGLKKYDLTDTDYLRFLIMMYADAMKEAVLRLAWFGDTDAAHTNDSPAGIITPGTTLGYFTPFDGFWKQIFEIVAANSERHDTTLSSRNGQATYSAQQFTTTDTTNKVVTTALQNLIFSADERLRDSGEAFILTTLSVADQYTRELQAASGIAPSWEIIQLGDGNGSKTAKKMNSLGVTIYAFPFWDRYIKAYENDGTRYNSPHRALYVEKRNLKIGVEEEANLSEFDTYYWKKDHVQVSEAAWSEDAKIVLDDQIQVAY